MTQGVEITVKEYATWVKRWEHLFNAYANLDVIKNAEETWNNQKKLEKMGLAPIPAFHVLEDFKWLKKYAKSYPYIALGVAGMQSRKNAIMAWITKCFITVEDRAVFHGFGLTSWRVMSSFPWYSVDSSSWGSGFRYGRVPLFDEKKGTFFIVSLGTNEPLRKSELIESYGFSSLDFADRAKNDRAKICAISDAFLFIGLDLTSRDQLHEAWGGKWLWPKMFALIVAGSVISYLLNRNAGMIAIASLVAFMSAGLVDAVSYQFLHKQKWLIKVNGSNVFSAATDSLVFPTIAFGSFLPLIVLGQFIAKMAGGFIWSLVINKFRSK